MALNTQLDSYEFPTLALPYDKSTRELDNTPRLVDGLNMLATQGGKLIKRPGMTSTAMDTTQRIDRLVVYETAAYPYLCHVLASMYHPGSPDTWEMFVWVIGVDSAWRSLGTLRALNVSTKPHEIVITRGRVYIKGFPASGNSEKLGTVIYDADASVGTTIWGLLGPTVPARLGGVVTTLTGLINASVTTIPVTATASFPGSFPFTISVGNEDMSVSAKTSTTFTVTRAANGTTAAAHHNASEALYRDWSVTYAPMAVNIGWTYTYAWKTKTGHISNRAPIETNIDYRPSFTGGLLNVIPKIVVQGHADTTNVPTIVIYRKTDGGGVFLKLGEVTNTGAGDITVSDNFLASLGGNSGPLPDDQLDTSAIAPSLTSNSPPPTVLSPSVVGTDTPVQCSPMVVYAGRIWYAIADTVQFSGQEEIISGNPEESFPSGLSGNFYRFPRKVVSLIATTEALYVITSSSVFWIRGTLKETFTVSKLFGEIGGNVLYPRAAIPVGNSAVWFSSDFRIMTAQGNSLRALSAPLGQDIISRSSGTSSDWTLTYFAELDKQFIIVSHQDLASGTAYKQWVYDVAQSSQDSPFWNVPWDMQATAMTVDRLSLVTGRRNLLIATWDNSAVKGTIGIFDSTEVTVRDMKSAAGGANPARDYAISFTTNLLTNPAGDHVNLLRRPAMVTTVYGYILERTKFTSDNDPTVTRFRDDLYTTPITDSVLASPSRRQPSKGYSSLFYMVNEACTRISLKVDKAAANERFEAQTLAVTFNPDGGA